jgi:hypothetical protein
MKRLQVFSAAIRRSTKRRQQRIRRERLSRRLLSETLEHRRLLAAPQPLDGAPGKAGEHVPPQAEPIEAFPREKLPARDIADLTRNNTTAWQKTAESVFGSQTDAKDGALRKVGTDLAFVFHEFDEFKVERDKIRRFPGPLQEFKAQDRLLKLHGAVDDEKVVVDVIAYGDPAQLKDDLTKLGMDVTGVHRQIVSGLVPIDKIDALADHRAVRSVRSFASQTASGAVVTQGDAAQLADDLRSVNGVDGFGVTVGLLSDSYDNLGGAAADVTSGDLAG